jgi:hypothetical protein
MGRKLLFFLAKAKYAIYFRLFTRVQPGFFFGRDNGLSNRNIKTFTQTKQCSSKIPKTPASKNSVFKNSKNATRKKQCLLKI